MRCSSAVFGVGVWGAVGLVFLFAHDAFASLDPDLEEAAESAGARRWRAHLSIALPLALPGLLTALRTQFNVETIAIAPTVFEVGEASIQSNLRHKDGTCTPYFFTGRRLVMNGIPCLVGVGVIMYWPRST